MKTSKKSVMGLVGCITSWCEDEEVLEIMLNEVKNIIGTIDKLEQENIFLKARLSNLNEKEVIKNAQIKLKSLSENY